MKSSRSVRFLAAIAAVSGSVLLTAAAAQAATHPGSAQHAPKAQAMTESVSSTYSPAGFNAASNPCGSVTTRVNGYESGLLQWWVQLKTGFCWNGTTVTSHSTSLSHAQGRGWNFSPGGINFNCLTTNGHACSGNHEHNTSTMFNTNTIVLVYINIDQYEYYNGTWKYNWSTNTY